MAKPLAVLTWKLSGCSMISHGGDSLSARFGHAWNDLKSGGLLYCAHPNERDDANFASVADAAEAFLFEVFGSEPGQFGHSAVFEFPDY